MRSMCGNKFQKHLDPDTWFITYDVTSMYTNMTATELVQSAAKALTKLKQNEASIKILQVEYLVELLKILLENNKFEFDGHLYKQIVGASMGAVSSLEVCDLRLFDILENIIKRTNIKRKL